MAQNQESGFGENFARLTVVSVVVDLEGVVSQQLPLLAGCYLSGLVQGDVFKFGLSDGCMAGRLDGGKGVQGCQIDQSGSLCEGTGEKWKNIPVLENKVKSIPNQQR